MFSFLFVKKGVDWNLQSLTAPWKCRECTGSQRPQVIGKTSWPLGHRRAITVHYGADMSQSSRWHVVQMSDEHERRAVDVRFNEFFFRPNFNFFLCFTWLWCIRYNRPGAEFLRNVFYTVGVGCTKRKFLNI